MTFDALHDLLVRAASARVAPAAVAEVGRAAGPLWRDAVGALSYGAPARAATPDTVFDLASLTKVIGTTTLAMRLFDAHRLALDAPVRDLVPEWQRSDRSGVTVRDLLEHASGLPAVLPLYERCTGRMEFLAAICDAPLDYTPGTRSIYSDLGFILLGFIIEDAGKAPLDVQWREVARGLDLAETDVLAFGPRRGPAELARTAPTQVDAWRDGRLLQGEVDDRNGAALGGIAGHTGMFGTVGAVGRFARELLRGRVGQPNALAQPATVLRFVQRTAVPGSSRALGWDTMLPTSSCGTLMSPAAFGHTGFTGTSLWIDPDNDLYAVLLTNRVHPLAGSADPIQALRRAFHEATVRSLDL